MNARLFVSTFAWLGVLVLASPARAAETIPLPEHPRPDFERAAWLNLNGTWGFQFDPEQAGETAGWASPGVAFPDRITVPFPWGSPLSGVTRSDTHVAWYRRSIRVPESWKGQRVYLVVGACDWLTRGWLDGTPLGEHRGGYTPFSMDLTAAVRWGEDQEIVLRVDDSPHPFKLEGKQGYGEAKGIWQTVYLEARPEVHVSSVQITPDVPAARAAIRVRLNAPAPRDTTVRVRLRHARGGEAAEPVAVGAREARIDVTVPDLRLWSLDDPFLYEADVMLDVAGTRDRISTYFGMRTISVERLPGSGHPYVALNGRPVYLQMALDQSYHPEGFYTFPRDAFMRDEILRSKRLGLNGNRVHIKVEVPRKLYWADRLGLLIMADVPNFWGDPTPEARRESEFALRGMIDRDFNHPSIFSWVVYNETWGLFTQQGETKTYLPETQEWVASMYRLAKQLDPTRLVEDNSPCNKDHVETDLNTWHDYLPGYAWREHLDTISRQTFPGSTWNFIGGRAQADQPMFNSECGNVWGYDNSTGDVDWSWDYHIMLNEFRRHPKVAGWLYTEHHDVVNEWNGYYRYDRSDKVTGLDAFVPDMSLADLHAPLYLSTGSDLCRETAAGARVEVPVFASFMTGEPPAARLVLRHRLHGWDRLGRTLSAPGGQRDIPFEPWLARELEPLQLTMPDAPGLWVLALALETPGGSVLHRNFTTFLVGGRSPRSETSPASPGRAATHIVRFAPAAFSAAEWSQKHWNVLDGAKVNGAGHGYFEYRLAWPEGLRADALAGASLVCELSAKQLFGKDRDGAVLADGDYMRGRGTHDPSANPNAYPMTDTVAFPSAVRVRLNGEVAAVVPLADDPADHRGVLSWHAQLRDRRLREAGSYGYLVQVPLPATALATAASQGELILRLEVDAAVSGGLAIYGERFGRYPVEPAIVFERR